MRAATPAARLNLLGCDRGRLERFFAERGEKPFRARQALRRLCRDAGATAETAAEKCLIDLPKSLREDVLAATEVAETPLAADLPAADGSRKLLFDVGGGERVEAVILPERRRTTLCVSSQVGCALACEFCLTGRQGFSRNLTVAQIVSQLRTANRLLATDGAQTITNIVFMGMGEPLLNADAVLPALRLFTDPLAYGLSPRRVTVSTAGIVPAMARLREECDAALAVSLHAPTDKLRDELMPINRKYPLATLMEACRRHVADAPRAYVTFEYVMLDGVNDADAQARELVRLLHGVRCKVNLIPFNDFAGAGFCCPSPQRTADFRARLMRGGIMTTIRRRRGDDILAACGQLAGDVRARAAGLGRRRVLPLAAAK